MTPPGKPKEDDPSAENESESLDFSTIYNRNCAGCHGADGKNGPGRILNDTTYLAFIPREALRKVLENGRAGTAMPPWASKQGGPLNDKQISVLVDGMYSRWGKASPPSDAPLPEYAQENPAGDVKHGKQLFVRGCYMCHGKGAKVGPVTEPAYLALVSNQMLRTSIVIGRADLGMPNYRYLNLGKPLSNGDVDDLVTYLVSLRPPPTKGSTMGTGEGTESKGNEGSGNGPGSPAQKKNEGNKSNGSSSEQGVK